MWPVYSSSWKKDRDAFRLINNKNKNKSKFSMHCTWILLKRKKLEKSAQHVVSYIYWSNTICCLMVVLKCPCYIFLVFTFHSVQYSCLWMQNDCKVYGKWSYCLTKERINSELPEMSRQWFQSYFLHKLTSVVGNALQVASKVMYYF